MTVETTSYYDSLTSASTSAAVTASTSSSSLTSDDFLTLLCTEIEYQDPTEPMSNTEMVDQMTQYSQLEELGEINEQLEAFTESMASMTAASGLQYIGKEVEADGYTVSKSDDDISTLYFELDDDAATVTANIYDSSGSIVNTVTFSDVDSGGHSYEWDGTDFDGDTVDDGNYYILVTAVDSEGDDIDVSTSTTGTVAGVSTTDDGVMFTLEDGRTVYMADVTYATS